MVQLNPNSSTSYANYGAILHLNGKFREAENMYKKAIQLNSNNQICKDNLMKLQKMRMAN